MSASLCYCSTFALYILITISCYICSFYSMNGLWYIPLCQTISGWMPVYDSGFCKCIQYPCVMPNPALYMSHAWWVVPIGTCCHLPITHHNWFVAGKYGPYCSGNLGFCLSQFRLICLFVNILMRFDYLYVKGLPLQHWSSCSCLIAKWHHISASHWTLALDIKWQYLLKWLYRSYTTMIFRHLIH